MRFDILTLFPEMIDAVMQTSIIGRAQQAGLVSIRQISAILLWTSTTAWMTRHTAAEKAWSCRQTLYFAATSM